MTSCRRRVRGARRDAVEVYVPAFFKDFVKGKAEDVDGFMAGAADYVRQSRGSG